MLRLSCWFGLCAGLLIVSSSVWAESSPVPPSLVLATLQADGGLLLMHTMERPRAKAVKQTYTKSIEIEEDGVTSVAEEQKEITVTQLEFTKVCFPESLPSGGFEVLDMQRKPVSAEVVQKRLKKETLVLYVPFGTPPAYFLNVYKPDTLLIRAKPGEVAEAAPPAPGAPEPAPVPEEAPAEPEEAPAAPEEAPAPEAAPPAVNSPTAQLSGTIPRLEFASIQIAPIPGTREVNATVRIRTYFENTEKSTDDDPTTPITHSLKTSSVTELDRRFVKFFSTEGDLLDPAAAAKILSKERLVLVTLDGGPANPFWLTIVKPATLIVALPPELILAEIGPPRPPAEDTAPADAPPLPEPTPTPAEAPAE